jgi:hypothetical protein
MSRLALAIIRRYPEAWRRRYEGEVLALIEDSPVRLRDRFWRQKETNRVAYPVGRPYGPPDAPVSVLRNATSAAFSSSLSRSDWMR